MLVRAIALALLVSACTTTETPPPGRFEVLWAKPNVPYESFVADIDACAPRAQAARTAVPYHRGDPVNDQVLPIHLWRSLVTGAHQEAAAADAYAACFQPRGYRLIYVSEADAMAFEAIGFIDDPQTTMDASFANLRERQLRFLHALASAPRSGRAGAVRNVPLVDRVHGVRDWTR
ncbi:MAG: hypothetical protein K2P58_02540 [Hyphomonadaceae bacterium]|nr:hypothetical protein [Hyphomonadaceae bacterium]